MKPALHRQGTLPVHECCVPSEKHSSIAEARCAHRWRSQRPRTVARWGGRYIMLDILWAALLSRKKYCSVNRHGTLGCAPLGAVWNHVSKPLTAAVTKGQRLDGLHSRKALVSSSSGLEVQDEGVERLIPFKDSRTHLCQASFVSEKGVHLFAVFSDLPFLKVDL